MATVYVAGRNYLDSDCNRLILRLLCELCTEAERFQHLKCQYPDQPTGIADHTTSLVAVISATEFRCA